MIPYVGQEVQYYSNSAKGPVGSPLAAIVTSVVDSTHVRLMILGSKGDGPYMKGTVAYGSTQSSGTAYCLPTGATANVYYVDATTGANTNSGQNWSAPYQTMAKALSVITHGDFIFFRGTISEDTLTLSKNNVTIAGTLPSNGANVWQQAAADTTLLTITGTGCILNNIKFRPSAYSAATPDGIVLNGANYTQILGCRFQGRAGSWYAISTPGNADNVLIRGCEFLYMNTTTYGTAIRGYTYTADVIPSFWRIEDNIFESNLNHINCRMRNSYILRNHFAAGGLAAAGTQSATLTVLGIDLHGGSNAGYNVVTQNFLGSLYHQACYYGGTNDAWAGNFCVDRTHATQVDATTGISILAPAA